MPMRRNEDFDSNRLFAFLRSFGNTTLLVVANFSEAEAHVRVNIPAHAFDYMELTEGKKDMVDLLSGDQQTAICSKTVLSRWWLQDLVEGFINFKLWN